MNPFLSKPLEDEDVRDRSKNGKLRKNRCERTMTLAGVRTEP